MTGDRGIEIEDPILTRFHEQVRAEESLAADAGGDSDRGEDTTPSSELPYDLEAEAPRAVSLRKLADLSNQTLPKEVAAALGDYEPIVLLHGLTPFHRIGERPREVWGLGYQARLLDAGDARTVAYEPGNHFIHAAELSQNLAIDIEAKGGMSLGIGGDGDGAMVAAGPGLRAKAGLRQGVVLSLNVEISALEIQAGPVGAGGVRWNLYRQAKRLDRHHRLVQTALIPRTAQRLRIEIKTWVRRRGLFFGVFGNREWMTQSTIHEVPVDATMV